MVRKMNKNRKLRATRTTFLASKSLSQRVLSQPALLQPPVQANKNFFFAQTRSVLTRFRSVVAKGPMPIAHDTFPPSKTRAKSPIVPKVFQWEKMTFGGALKGGFRKRGEAEKRANMQTNGENAANVR